MSQAHPAEETVNASRARGVTAVLGPTNTGKTHLAIERMLGHQSGMIGLPLRLLAREVYDRVAKRVGADQVALITGEEKIKPDNPRYWVSTVEAMPRSLPVDFLAIDEIQLAADPERGHVFTDRLLHARGNSETLLLGAATMRDAIRDLVPSANSISRPRLSKLTYAGEKKLSRLPRRTAIVAFSAAEVYEIAELVRRQHGGAAVVLGALSPRTRNAQVALYQNGDVDYLVATDAIGMGLNLDVDHIAFAGLRKFDGRVNRMLTPAEIGQIAGRAGRHMNDGTFGVTGDAEPLSPELIEALEKHEFEPVKVLQWRSTALDFSSLERLRDSLRTVPGNPRLTRARMADDVVALEHLSVDSEIIGLATNSERIKKLWDVCQIPDYRKTSAQAHTELIGTLFRFLTSPFGQVPEDWFAEHVNRCDRTDGDIDTLAGRIAHVRTWTFVANHPDWVEHADAWEQRTREIENKLSDAMHERLAQRFVDQRTSALIKRLRDDSELVAEIADDGAIKVEQHYVGRLVGFNFSPDQGADGIHEKAARAAAMQVVNKEVAMRARRVAVAQADAFKLTRAGRITWRGEEIAKLERSDDPLKPVVTLIADESLSGGDREKVQERVSNWVSEQINERLKSLVELVKAEDVTGLARGIGFRLTENFGIVKREAIAEEVKQLDQEARAQLRKYGLRFGAFNLYFPLLLKPASIELALLLWTMAQSGKAGASEWPDPPRAGLTSVPAVPGVSEDFYRAAGYHVSGPRAVRVDMLERLADMIRPLVAWRANEAAPTSPPKGATGDGGFIVLPEMMSILGCGQGELGEVLRALGFRSEKKPKPPVRPAVAVVETVVAAEPAIDGSAVAATSEAVVDEAAVAATASPQAEEPTSEAPAAVDAVAASADTSVAVESMAELEPAITAELPAEPEMIEVWRPRRHRQSDRPARGERRERQERHRRPSRQAPAADGAVAAAAPADAAASEVAQANPDAAARPRRERDHRRGDAGKGRDGGQRRDGEANAGEKRDNRNVRPERPDRDKERPRNEGHRDGGGRQGRDRERDGGNRPSMWRSSERSDRRDNYDPNSPFAALGKLKADLEEQQRKSKQSS